MGKKVSNHIIKYDGELNTIPLRKFTPVEMNLFFSIVSRMRNKGDNVVRFSFDQLRELSDYKATANNRFIDDIQSTYEKLMQLHFGNRSANGLTREFFVMFTRFKIEGNVDEPFVEVQVNDMALPLLNNLDTWVRYSLMEFRDLQSSYSKTMFRLLKGFRTTGWTYFSKDDFNELLGVPKSYRESDISKNILKPIKEELSPIFQGLKVTKMYGKGRGKPVVGYKFTWKREDKNADDFFKGEYAERSKKLQNIKHNGELTYDEKKAATARIISDEELAKLPDFLNPLLETPKEKNKRVKHATDKLDASLRDLASQVLVLQKKKLDSSLSATEQKKLDDLLAKHKKIQEERRAIIQANKEED